MTLSGTPTTKSSASPVARSSLASSTDPTNRSSEAKKSYWDAINPEGVWKHSASQRCDSRDVAVADRDVTGGKQNNTTDTLDTSKASKLDDKNNVYYSSESSPDLSFHSPTSSRGISGSSSPNTAISTPSQKSKDHEAGSFTSPDIKNGTPPPAYAYLQPETAPSDSDEHQVFANADAPPTSAMKSEQPLYKSSQSTLPDPRWVAVNSQNHMVVADTPPQSHAPRFGSNGPTGPSGGRSPTENSVEWTSE